MCSSDLSAQARLHCPSPRVNLGLALRGLASAAIDISDGLLGDLGHILDQSHTGALLYASTLPVGPVLAQRDRQQQLEFALNGGDDYELCFSAPAAHHEAVRKAALGCNTPVTCIGVVRPELGISVLDDRGLPLSIASQSFDHFAKL